MMYTSDILSLVTLEQTQQVLHIMLNLDITTRKGREGKEKCLAKIPIINKRNHN